MRPGKRRKLDPSNPRDAIVNEIERLKASVRAKIEHPFRVIKRQHTRAPRGGGGRGGRGAPRRGNMPHTNRAQNPSPP